MSNALNQNPIVLDTVGATSARAQKIRIKALWWEGAANGNTLVLHDAASGTVIWQSTWVTGHAPHHIYFGEEGHQFDGLYLTTLGGGTLLVYEA